MTTIETEHGKFTADTESAALKLSRDAARKAKKQEKIAESNRDTARNNAKANVFGILNRLVSGEDAPCGWRVHKPGDERFPKSVVSEDGSRNIYRFTHLSVSSTESASATLKLFRGGRMTDKLAGVMVQGGTGVQIVWIETSGEIQTFAIGEHDGVTVTVRLTDISMDRLDGKRK